MRLAALPSLPFGHLPQRGRIRTPSPSLVLTLRCSTLSPALPHAWGRGGCPLPAAARRPSPTGGGWDAPCGAALSALRASPPEGENSDSLPLPGAHPALLNPLPSPPPCLGEGAALSPPLRGDPPPRGEGGCPLCASGISPRGGEFGLPPPLRRSPCAAQPSPQPSPMLGGGGRPLPAAARRPSPTGGGGMPSLRFGHLPQRGRIRTPSPSPPFTLRCSTLSPALPHAWGRGRALSPPLRGDPPPRGEGGTRFLPSQE